MRPGQTVARSPILRTARALADCFNDSSTLHGPKDRPVSYVLVIGMDRVTLGGAGIKMGVRTNG
ncbi:MAG: hypothetical protein K9H25_16255 [Rhodospirillum sp.]|nr:hypothetical protein [Rhodospirillum sp.]MCF8489641.1 hypothetical protein [Rhodospirillum sp.]MCF8500555.1 hypothetical protein [Rhodospirillum sp.]